MISLGHRIARKLTLIIYDVASKLGPISKQAWSNYFTSPYRSSNPNPELEVVQNYDLCLEVYRVTLGLPDLLVERVLELGRGLCISSRRSTQICNHGLLLSGLLYSYISNAEKGGCINIFETGTAKGFSTFCMAETLEYLSVKDCRIYTCDLIPHDVRAYWDLPTDEMGKVSRKELMSSYGATTEKYAVYLECSSKLAINVLNLQRINFAFLDAGHKASDIVPEMLYVIKRQQVKDMILIDDYSDEANPEFSQCVQKLCREYNYSLEVMPVYPLQNRCIAVARRLS